MTVLERRRSTRLEAVVMMAVRVFSKIGLCLLMGWTILCQPASAQERVLPYWASLRNQQVNMRVGPSREYPISWIYRRQGLPVKVVRLREGWRLVQDPQGAQGWVAASQLNPSRSVLVIGETLAELRAAPDSGSALRWRAEPGVVAALLRCRSEWCEIDAGGRTGWVRAAQLWGAEDLPGNL